MMMTHLGGGSVASVVVLGVWGVVCPNSGPGIWFPAQQPPKPLNLGHARNRSSALKVGGHHDDAPWVPGAFNMVPSFGVQSKEGLVWTVSVVNVWNTEWAIPEHDCLGRKMGSGQHGAHPGQKGAH